MDRSYLAARPTSDFTMCRASHCDQTINKCVAFKKDGETCDEDDPGCLPFHKCLDGTCAPNDPSLCK
ncbi:MAG: hypothetical protein KIT84_33740 [Labilithrix sp.]|nr:hypothetical protein [Labilithrix sp.]MCW5816011.1 hypothetical protein [Labilithrix sp.]